MGNLEAIGDAVTGGLLGRTVEPQAGEATDGHSQETQCLNCGARLTGPFCHECGQQAHVHRTLHVFFHDFAHGVLHFEGKIWRTVPMLAFHSGELTRRYIDGQRARFVSPIALFLFCVFLMFAVMGLTEGMGQPSAKAAHDIAKELGKDQQKLAILQKNRADLAKAGVPTGNIDGQISDVSDQIAALTSIKNSRLPAELPNNSLELGGDSVLPDWLVEAVAKAKQNPELVFYKIKTNAYKFSWALIPISVPFVWLLFPFSRRFRLYDHTVFVTYSLSFMMLLLVAGTLVGLVSSGLASLAWFVPPIHMYRQLKGTYGLGRWAAVWRSFALTIFAFIAISLFASMLIAIGAFE